MSAADTPTPPQLNYLFRLRVRWSLSDAALDTWCKQRFKRRFAELTKSDASALIDELSNWTDIPADLRRLMGQPTLPGFNRLLRDQTR